MAKRPKHGVLTLTPEAIETRLQKAIAEDRLQQALELAKQLFKADPSPQHRDLLRQAYLGRAAQQRKQGHFRDAQTTLQNAVNLAQDDPASLESIAEELARCGATGQALRLMATLPEAPAQARVAGLAADWAIVDGTAGARQLPAEIQSQLELVVKAIRHIQNDEDEAAREVLQGIGLQSPFLEWKLFLRGLQAYYQKDDSRAAENWRRLDPQRMAARVAAPLWYGFDASFRKLQSPEMQSFLQHHAERLQDTGLLPGLRSLQKDLAHADRLPQAFRVAEGLLPGIRQQAPQLVPRLASCFYWSIIARGEQADITRYERLFGHPADDPTLDRLRALFCEQIHDLPAAHDFWQRYDKALAAHPEIWPPDLARRARAMVWCRMGVNATHVPGKQLDEFLPAFLRDHPDRPRPLDPPAERCFERSLELAPDQLQTHVELVDYYAGQANDRGRAEQACRRLLQHFPDHVPSLENLADFRRAAGDHAESVALLDRAVKINPLDRKLRDELGTAHIFRARAHAEAGRFDEARTDYQAALSLSDADHGASVHCKWAACEFKAGNAARAEELVQQALAESGEPLGVAFNMLIESIRLKLPPSVKRRFEREFKAGLAAPPTAKAAATLASTAGVHRLAKVEYSGQKTHEKKVLAYVERARKLDFTDRQLENLCRGLLGLGAVKPLRTFTARGQREFPKNPKFLLFEANSHIKDEPGGFLDPKLNPLLQKAEQLTREMPAGRERDELLEFIEARKQMSHAHNLFSNPAMLEMMQSMMGGGMLDDNEFYEDDEFDEGW